MDFEPQLPNQFVTDGFTTLPAFFDDSTLHDIEETIVSLYAMQGKKIGEYRNSISSMIHGTPYQRLTAILEVMEDADKAALYQVQKFLSASERVRSPIAKPLIAHVCDLMGWEPDTTLVDGPALFVNRPKTDRLLYRWHSEAHYYPKRRNFVNVWIPLFTDRTKKNGAMSVRPRTQLTDFPFAEYDSGPHTFKQYEIPESLLQGYSEEVCEAKRGDAVLFDRQLVHRSNANQSTDYGFSIVCRIWNPENDLTLSGNIAATPYGGDLGRANLQVAA